MKNTDEALVELIKKGIETEEKTGQFVIDQAPELIQQFYTWHICQNLLGLIIGLLCVYGSYKAIVKFGEEESNWDTPFVLFNKHVGIGTCIVSSILFVLLAFLFANA